MSPVDFLQQKLAQMLSKLTKIANEYNVAVFMTNQGQTLPALLVEL